MSEVDGGSTDASVGMPDGAGVDARCAVPEGAVAVGIGIPRAGLTCTRHPFPLRAPRDVIVARDGTIYVSESGAGRIVRFDGGETGFSVVAEGLVSPIGLRELADGDLVIAEEGAGSIARIDVATGARTEIASGLRAVTYVTIGPDTALYVSSFAEVAPSATGIVWRVDVGSGVATPFVSGMNVPEGHFFDGERFVVAEWHLPSAVLRFEAGGGDASAAETLGTGYENVYGLVPDGEGGVLVADHAGRIVQLRADGTEEDVLVGIGKPGGMTWTPSRELLIAEFVDHGATGWLITLSGFDP